MRRRELTVVCNKGYVLVWDRAITVLLLVVLAGKMGTILVHVMVVQNN